MQRTCTEKAAAWSAILARWAVSVASTVGRANPSSWPVFVSQRGSLHITVHELMRFDVRFLDARTPGVQHSRRSADPILYDSSFAVIRSVCQCRKTHPCADAVPGGGVAQRSRRRLPVRFRSCRSGWAAVRLVIGRSPFRLLKTSAMRNRFLLLRPAAFIMRSFGAAGMCALRGFSASGGQQPGQSGEDRRRQGPGGLSRPRARALPSRPRRGARPPRPTAPSAGRVTMRNRLPQQHPLRQGTRRWTPPSGQTDNRSRTATIPAACEGPGRGRGG